MILKYWEKQSEYQYVLKRLDTDTSVGFVKWDGFSYEAGAFDNKIIRWKTLDNTEKLSQAKLQVEEFFRNRGYKILQENCMNLL